MDQEMSTGVSPRLCEPPTKMYSMIRKKKMMTSMSSLFLCGAVFVEVWLVDVGIAEENPEPVNDPVGACVDRRSDVLYDL